MDVFGLKQGIHPVAPDYSTKFLHGTFDGIELSIKPGNNGNLVFKNVFSSDLNIDKAIKNANEYFADSKNIEKTLHNLLGSKEYYDNAGKGREWKELKTIFDNKLVKCHK